MPSPKAFRPSRARTPLGRSGMKTFIRNRVADFAPRLSQPGYCETADNPDDWTEDETGEAGHQARARAAALCLNCPVLNECLEWALAHDPRGVWGGLTEAERHGRDRDERISTVLAYWRHHQVTGTLSSEGNMEEAA